MDRINVTTEEALIIKCKLRKIEPLSVVAGLVEKDGKYLIAKRANGNDLVVGKWEFPGGKVEEGEEESAAIERELREEFELHAKADKFLCNVVYEYPTKIINLKLWHANLVDEDFSMDESDHKAYKWATLEEIGNYELCPADRVLYNKINI